MTQTRKDDGTTTKPHVAFYTKPGCHLCEAAKLEIERAACQGRYTFEEVNIESDAALLKQYGWEIPVVVINGTIVFKYRLTTQEFKREIERYSKTA
ncbi:MAG TPA: glutaredoxin family protein [Pyrinomonadaceae bacterium]|jgi:glutaredoxin|nr:glutaredoxin family protein [Pyrinomonadaceae bacterium]